MIAQREGLADGQSDHPGERELRFLEVICRRRRALLFGAELHLGTQHVDASDQPALPEIDRLGEERLCRLQLRAGRVGARGCGDSLEVQIRRDEDDEVARALVRVARRGDVVRRRPCIVDGAQIEHRLRHEQSHVEHIERSDDRRDARRQWKPEDGQVDLLPVLGQPRARVREEIAESRPACAARQLDVLLRHQDAEVVLERAIDRVDGRERDRIARRRPRRDAARKRTDLITARRLAHHRCRCRPARRSLHLCGGRCDADVRREQQEGDQEDGSHVETLSRLVRGPDETRKGKRSRGRHEAQRPANANL